MSLDEYEDDEIVKEDAFIKLKEEYNYKISIEVKEDNYKFEGSKTKQKETIKK